MRRSLWMTEHVDFMEHLIRENLSAQEMATRMSRQFRRRITPSQIGSLLARMRKSTDPFYRNIPYRREGRSADP